MVSAHNSNSLLFFASTNCWGFYTLITMFLHGTCICSPRSFGVLQPPLFLLCGSLALSPVYPVSACCCFLHHLVFVFSTHSLPTTPQSPHAMYQSTLLHILTSHFYIPLTLSSFFLPFASYFLPSFALPSFPILSVSLQSVPLYQKVGTVIWSCLPFVTSPRAWSSCRPRPSSPGRSFSRFTEASKTCGWAHGTRVGWGLVMCCNTAIQMGNSFFSFDGNTLSSNFTPG